MDSKHASRTYAIPHAVCMDLMDCLESVCTRVYVETPLESTQTRTARCVCVMCVDKPQSHLPSVSMEAQQQQYMKGTGFICNTSNQPSRPQQNTYALDCTGTATVDSETHLQTHANPHAVCMEGACMGGGRHADRSHTNPHCQVCVYNVCGDPTTAPAFSFDGGCSNNNG